MTLKRGKTRRITPTARGQVEITYPDGGNADDFGLMESEDEVIDQMRTDGVRLLWARHFAVQLRVFAHYIEHVRGAFTDTRLLAMREAVKKQLEELDDALDYERNVLNITSSDSGDGWTREEIRKTTEIMYKR